MPNTILHIDSSARKTGSITRIQSARIVDFLAPQRVVRRDLSAEPLPHITEAWVGATFTPANDRTVEQKATLGQSDLLVDELEAADTIVIGAPIYNFSLPAALKTWIDLIARVGRTFRYSEAGPEGLLSGKKVIVVIASGGTQLGSAYDFSSAYLRHIFGFVGITDLTIVTGEEVEGDLAAALNKDVAAAAA